MLPRGHSYASTECSFKLQLMRFGLLTNVVFYFVCSALGNVVMAYFIIRYDSVQISHLLSSG